MKKTLIVLMIAMVTQIGHFGFAQTTSTSLVMVKRFPNELMFDTMQEWAFRVSNYRDTLSDKTNLRPVLRLCTNEPIEAALMKSTLSFPAIIEIFEGFGFERKNIILLKTKECITTKGSSPITTELWVTMDENELPPYSEKYRASEINFKQENAQTGKKSQENKVLNCEDAQRIVSTINNLKVNDNLIIISRMGKKETNKLIGRKRLEDIKSYLENAWKRDPQTIILAEGERVAGKGRIDFYVVGILFDSLVADKNKSIQIRCSED